MFFSTATIIAKRPHDAYRQFQAQWRFPAALRNRHGKDSTTHRVSEFFSEQLFDLCSVSLNDGTARPMSPTKPEEPPTRRKRSMSGIKSRLL
jgi:hypothetical protein